jgi:hypothetical protein
VTTDKGEQWSQRSKKQRRGALQLPVNCSRDIFQNIMQGRETSGSPTASLSSQEKIRGEGLAHTALGICSGPWSIQLSVDMHLRVRKSWTEEKQQEQMRGKIFRTPRQEKCLFLPKWEASNSLSLAYKTENSFAWGWVWWYMPVVPATWEAEMGGL